MIIYLYIKKTIILAYLLNGFELTDSHTYSVTQLVTSFVNSGTNTQQSCK